MSRNHAFAHLFILLGMAWFILWACAPMMSAPPSPPMAPDVTSEIGGGFNGGVAFNTHGSDVAVLPVGNLQFWNRLVVGPEKKNEAGFLAQAGNPSALSGGGYYRMALGQTEKTYTGLQFDLGLLWTGISLPVATKVGEHTWLTTKPSFRGSAASVAMLPVGLSWELGDSTRLDVEVGAHYGGILVAESETLFYPYAAVGISQPIGRVPSSHARPPAPPVQAATAGTIVGLQEASEPKTAEPETTTEPETTEPETPEPEASEPEAPEPEAPKPEAPESKAPDLRLRGGSL